MRDLNFPDVMIPWGDDGPNAAVVPPAEAAALWKADPNLERLRCEYQGTRLGTVLYAIYSAGMSHRARAVPSQSVPPAGAEAARPSGHATRDASPGRDGRPSSGELSTKETADRLGVGTVRVGQLRMKGVLVGHRVGRDWRYEAAAVETLAAGKEP